MTKKPISQAKDQVLASSLIGMQRAARMAREQAVRTDTAIIVLKNNVLVRISADELRKMGVR